MPSSVTLSSTCGPSSALASGLGCGTSAASTFAVRIVRVPPDGIASRALTARLVITCSSWPGSASTRPSTGSSSSRSVDVLADDPPQHRAQLRHDRVEVHDPRLEHLLPAEGQELAGERRRAVRGAVDLQHVEPALVVVADRPQQQLGVPDDGREEVVEVVGDAAGELADRLHLLRLPELFLQDLLLGHVPDVDQEVQRPARRRPAPPTC